MGNIVKIKGVVGFCGTDEEKNKDNLQIYLEDNNDALVEMNNLIKINKKIKSTISKVDAEKVKLVDLDLNKYIYKATLKNDGGETELLNLTGENIGLKDIKSGDEVVVIVEVKSVPYQALVYGSLKMLKVVKVRSQVYKFSPKSKAELEEEDKESNRLLQEIMENEKGNLSYSDQTEL